MNVEAFVQDTVSRSLNKYLELHPDGGVPAGGTEGQTLVKTSDADGEVGWADVMTQDALDNRTLTPSGWGVAKTGVVRIDLPGNDGVGVNVDLTDLNFASVDDYNAVIAVSGGNSAWGRALVYCRKESPTQLSIGAYKAESGSSYVEVSYVVVAKGYGGTHFAQNGLPVGGEGGQILTKIGNEEGVADWGFDNGADLVKFGRKYGSQPASFPITQAVGESTGQIVSTVPMYRVKKGGVLRASSFVDGILNTFDMYLSAPGYVEMKVTELYATYNSRNGYKLSGTSATLTLWKDSARLYEDDNYLYIGLTFNTASADFSSVRFVAKGNNNFGLSDGTAPYDIRNLTGMVLDDLKIAGNAVPTDWGIATVTKTSISIPSGNSATQTIDVSGFGFESADDYTVSCNIFNGAGDWAKATINVGSKSATSFMLIVKAVASDITRVDLEYTIFAKGYGNTTMSAPNAILESPNGTKYKLIVADDGTLSTEAV